MDGDEFRSSASNWTLRRSRPKERLTMSMFIQTHRHVYIIQYINTILMYI